MLLTEIAERASAGKVITKADINGVLKSFDHGFVKVISDTRFNSESNYKSPYDGKFRKGIYASSHSPMDATSIKRDKAEATKAKVRQALLDLGLKQEGSDKDALTANPDTKKSFKVLITLRMFPAYARSIGRDPDYQNSYVVVDFV